MAGVVRVGNHAIEQLLSVEHLGARPNVLGRAHALPEAARILATAWMYSGLLPIRNCHVQLLASDHLTTSCLRNSKEEFYSSHSDQSVARANMNPLAGIPWGRSHVPLYMSLMAVPRQFLMGRSPL